MDTFEIYTLVYVYLCVILLQYRENLTAFKLTAKHWAHVYGGGRLLYSSFKLFTSKYAFLLLRSCLLPIMHFYLLVL